MNNITLSKKSPPAISSLGLRSSNLWILLLTVLGPELIHQFTEFMSSTTNGKVVDANSVAQFVSEDPDKYALVLEGAYRYGVATGKVNESEIVEDSYLKQWPKVQSFITNLKEKLGIGLEQEESHKPEVKGHKMTEFPEKVVSTTIVKDEREYHVVPYDGGKVGAYTQGRIDFLKSNAPHKSHIKLAPHGDLVVTVAARKVARRYLAVREQYNTYLDQMALVRFVDNEYGRERFIMLQAAIMLLTPESFAYYDVHSAKLRGR